MVPGGRLAEVSTGWWPVDRVIVAYLTVMGLLILALCPRVAGAGELLAWHAIGILLVLLAMRQTGRASWIFRHWYPLPYVAACYKEAAILIPSIRGGDLDVELARLDYRLWGAHPTVWLERIQTPALTEFLQIVYALFVPMVLLAAFLLWRRHLYAEFRFYAFLIALGFLASYVGYFIVPARGPRFLLHSLQSTRLQGLWLFQWLQGTLDTLESAHYDCFPSGHTELTVLACWGSRKLSKVTFGAYLAYTPCIIFATVYLRYHYTIDVLAGLVLAVLLVIASPHLYKLWQQRGHSIGRS
jgi:membrane-associated phospholipid phosphatase